MYKRYELGAVCDRLSSGKSIPASQILEQGTFPVYGGNGLRGYTNHSNFSGECAIIGRQGVFCGNVRYFKGEAYMTEHAVVICANEKHNTRYLSYLLSTMNLGRLSGQSAQPGLSVKTLAKQEIELPPLEQQNKIVDILAALDDKIELNQRINDNLQQQAHAIYYNWFIKYAPFGGFVPSNWRTGRLKNILQLQKRPIKADKKFNLPYLPIDMIPIRTFSVIDFCDNKEAQSSLIKFCKNDIVIGAMRVYFHRVILAPFDGITRTTCFILKPINPSYLCYALLTCDLDSSIEYAQKTSKGSTMPYAVWHGGMGEIELAIPTETVAKEFNKIVLPMLNWIQQNCSEIRILQSIRNTLLPKLLYGEVNVCNI